MITPLHAPPVEREADGGLRRPFSPDADSPLDAAVTAPRASQHLAFRVDVARFRDTMDTIPRPVRLSYGDLVDLIAPADPVVQHRVVEKEEKRLGVIDKAEWALSAQAEAPDWLADCASYRALERIWWTTDGDDDVRRAALSAAAVKKREEASRDTKKALPCWSPVRCFPCATRGVAAVDVVTCLVLDYDDGTGLDEALAPWLDWPLLAATTWSHSDDHPRFRVTLALDTPVAASAWPEVWLWAASHAVGTIDPSCKDPSRIYALPARKGVDSPYLRRVHDPGGSRLEVADHVSLTTALAADAKPLRTHASKPSPRTHASKPPRDAKRGAARELFRRDEEARRRAAGWLGAQVVGGRAEHVTCPVCGRPSVWFWLAPGSRSTAHCNHEHSCAWWGHLDELLDAPGGPHVG